jgi:quercetin dioxygenase-like cupin family protein
MSRYLSRGKHPPPVGRDAVARAWAARGFTCGLFCDPPGREWLDFVHGTNELVTVVEGRLRMTIAGESFIAEPGDEVFIPAETLHSVCNAHSGTSRWLYGYD